MCARIGVPESRYRIGWYRVTRMYRTHTLSQVRSVVMLSLIASQTRFLLSPWNIFHLVRILHDRVQHQCTTWLQSTLFKWADRTDVQYYSTARIECSIEGEALDEEQGKLSRTKGGGKKTQQSSLTTESSSSCVSFPGIKQLQKVLPKAERTGFVGRPTDRRRRRPPNCLFWFFLNWVSLLQSIDRLVVVLDASKHSNI